MRKAILLVDDNMDMLDGLKSVFLNDGFEVETAESGPKALQLLKNQFRPDLIILDVRMPGMNGPELLDKLEAEHGEFLRETSIVFSSAGKPPLDSRVSGFIDKMTDLGEYMAQVRKFLNFDQEMSA